MPGLSTSLEGKIAFVTGAARGIGRAICLALADAGADVAVTDLHPEPFRGEPYYRLRKRVSGEDEAVSTADAVRKLGRRSIELALDVCDVAGVEAAVQRCEKELGPIDILVNNAGIVNNIAPISSMEPEAWDHELRVNLSGGFHTVRAVAPGMAERGFGRVINIASVAALAPTGNQPAYSASKAGVVGFTRSVAQEFGPRGVTANAILPGLIRTPLVRSMPAEIRDGAIRLCPAGRAGEPEEIGALAAFLASPAAAYISATAIECDGGASHAAVGGLDSVSGRARS